jgi:hypothetical protein
MCAYDPAFDRVLLFGGGALDDLWELDLESDDGTWQELHLAEGPSERNLGLLRLDTRRNRLLLFGGYGVNRVEGYTTYLNETWALDLDATPTWRPLAPSGHPPQGRDRANGTFDPLNDRLVLTCGGAAGSNDTWAIAFTDVPTSTQLALVSSEASADRVRLVWAGAAPGASVTGYRRELNSEWRALGEWAADGRGFVVFEDRDVTPDTWLEYRLGVITGAGEAFFGAARVRVPARALTLAARVVGGHATFVVALSSGEPATLALFDVGGRRVWSRAVGHLGRGAHEVHADDAVLAPALYFARLTQDGATRLARVALVR